ncbi:hypothetical protein MRB53_020438 [Persea americana]|uniref:Uncharacterized protein n=1 Tax=Persea americana TaxID=3435 RepID=A0ACC2L0S8_PERAE|nr:hypothetical protein MRB53_020438 [Persea americana]
MASVSGVYNPSAEGQEARGKGKKGGSKDVMSSMEACLAKVELAIIGMWDQFDDTNSRIEELASVGEELKGEMQAIGGGVLTAAPTHRVDVPKPKEFKGTRSAKDIDNFLWGMEQYFRVMGIVEDATKVSTASMYLVDVALLWWRSRCNDPRLGGATITMWEEFQREFRQQFYPECAEDEERAKLRRLSQRGESLVEFKKTDKTDSSRNKGKGGGDKNRDKKRGRDRDNPSKSGSGKPPFQKWKSSKDGGKKDREPQACFLCDGPHRMRGCPKQGKLAAIAEKDKAERETLKLGSIILSSIKTKKSARQKGLMFVDIVVASNKMNALVDTRASDLFMSEIAAKKLGLLVEKGNGWIKTVNSREVPTMGREQGVEIQLGQWTGKEAIEVIPLDDYELVIGLDFLDRINALLVPFANCLCILDPRCQCIVPI